MTSAVFTFRPDDSFRQRSEGDRPEKVESKQFHVYLPHCGCCGSKKGKEGRICHTCRFVP